MGSGAQKVASQNILPAPNEIISVILSQTTSKMNKENCLANWYPFDVYFPLVFLPKALSSQEVLITLHGQV